MRTGVKSDAIFQLMITYKIKSYFISETEEGAKCKMAERQRERVREREQALGGGRYSMGCKMDRLENTHV
jgi:hypothetical protein